jgi:hypothetical protein
MTIQAQRGCPHGRTNREQALDEGPSAPVRTTISNDTRRRNN